MSSTTTNKWPDLLYFRLSDRSEAVVLPAKTHKEAIAFAREAFPDQLVHISSDQFCFSGKVQGLKARIMPSVWPITVRCFASETIVYVDIKPEPVALESPLTHDKITKRKSEGKNEYVVIFAFDKDNRAFVDPGSTLDDAIETAKSVFPSKLRHIPNNRITFARRASDAYGEEQYIMPSAWEAVIAKFVCKKPFENLYYTFNVHIRPEGWLGTVHHNTRSRSSYFILQNPSIVAVFLNNCPITFHSDSTS